MVQNGGQVWQRVRSGVWTLRKWRPLCAGYSFKKLTIKEVDLGPLTGANAACALGLEFNRKRLCVSKSISLSKGTSHFRSVHKELEKCSFVLTSAWKSVTLFGSISEGKASPCSQDRGDLLVNTAHHSLPEQALQGRNSMLLFKATGRMGLPFIKIRNRVLY